MNIRFVMMSLVVVAVVSFAAGAVLAKRTGWEPLWSEQDELLLQEAKANLGRLQEGNAFVFDSEEEKMRENIAKLGMTLEAAGTSENEISALRNAAYVNTASKWIEIMKKQPLAAATYMYTNALAYAENANRSLESFGTSAEELSRLRECGFLMLAHRLEVVPSSKMYAYEEIAAYAKSRDTSKLSNDGFIGLSDLMESFRPDDPKCAV